MMSVKIKRKYHKFMEENLDIIKNLLQSNGYKLGELLGSGGHSSCYKVIRAIGDFEFACKISYIPENEDGTKPEKLEICENEMNVLKMAQHPNIIQLYDIFIYKPFYILILEFCPGGDLENKRLKKEDLMTYSKQIIDAVSYLHSEKIAHHDLKPSNCLIDKNGRIKLADFGLSIKYSYPSSQQFKGTKIYTPPEVMKRASFDPFKADIWSLGMTLYSLMTGELPFKEISNPVKFRQEQELFHALSLYPRSNVYNTIAKTINMCAVFDPKNRPNISDVQIFISRYKPPLLPLLKSSYNSFSNLRTPGNLPKIHINSPLCSQLKPLGSPLSQFSGSKSRSRITEYKSERMQLKFSDLLEADKYK